MASRDPARPNLLFILTDDQGPWALGCAGNRELRTPRLDALAGQGLRFTNYFCVSPVCSPARASILTGQVPSRHGVHDWISAGNHGPGFDTWSDAGEKANAYRLVEYLAGQPTLPARLAAAGYACGLSGKWHLGDCARPQQGFTFWAAHAAGGGNYYRAPMYRDGKPYHEPRYLTDAITDNALAFLDREANTRVPFYLSVHYTAPHSPWDRGQHPAEDFEGYHRDCAFDSVPDEPPHPWTGNKLGPGRDPERRREVLSGYFAAVTAMDRNVGRLLDRLDALRLRDRTLVVFTSDNGMNMGHHGIYGKGNGTFPMNMYDTSVKVPFIVSLPGRTPAGSSEEGLWCHYDVMPTLLEFAGIEDPGAAQRPGRSFAPRLDGTSAREREAVVVYHEYGPVRMVRSKAWKLVVRHPYGPDELYRLAEDPDEKANLIAEPGWAGVVRDLRGQLDEFFVRHADPARDGSREAVTGLGQTGLCGPAAGGAPRFVPR